MNESQLSKVPKEFIEHAKNGKLDHGDFLSLTVLEMDDDDTLNNFTVYLKQNAEIKVSLKDYTRANESVSCEQLIKDVKNKLELEQAQQINSYYFITKDDNQVDKEILSKEGIDIIKANSNISAREYQQQYNAHIKKQLLSLDQYNIIITTLNADMTRLNTISIMQEPLIKEKVREINNEIKIFVQRLIDNKQPYTTSTILSKLDQLQHKILSKELVASIKHEYQHWLVTDTQKHFHELKSKLKSQPPPPSPLVPPVS